MCVQIAWSIHMDTVKVRMRAPEEEREREREGGGAGWGGKGEETLRTPKIGTWHVELDERKITSFNAVIFIILYYHYCYHYLSISVTEIHVALCCCHTKQARSKRLHTECCCSALTALLALWGFCRVESYQ